MRVVIIGAGMTGIGAAHALREGGRKRRVECTIVERENRPGGLCRTEEKGGFLFDYTGHLLHFKTEMFRHLIEKNLPSGIVANKRSSWIYSNDVYTRYPFQANLHGLPRDIIIECLYEFMKVAFTDRSQSARNLDEWITMRFGKGIAGYFMNPYNLKLFRRQLSELTVDTLGRFVALPDARQIIKGAISESDEEIGYNASFWYPRRGGIEEVVRALVRDLPRVETCQEVAQVDLARRIVVTAAGRTYPFDALVSTMPVTQLVRVIKRVPPQVRKAAERLRHVSVLNVNFGVKKGVIGRHWVYVPEKKFIFYRVGFPHNFAVRLAPGGTGSIYTEITYTPGEQVDQERTARKVEKDLVSMGIVRNRSEILVRKILDIPYGYVHFDHKREVSLSAIQSFLLASRVFSVGRFGSWTYTSMEDSFVEGFRTGQKILKTMGGR